MQLPQSPEPLHNPVASVTRPDARLTGHRRLELAPSEATRLPFRCDTGLSFTDRSGSRIVEPGALEPRPAGLHHGHTPHSPTAPHGPDARTGPGQRLLCETEVSR